MIFPQISPQISILSRQLFLAFFPISESMLIFPQGQVFKISGLNLQLSHSFSWHSFSQKWFWQSKGFLQGSLQE
jgi:hypothetical protein